MALGDIIGADILNILWIVGASSAVNEIIVEKSIIFFAFPVMIFVVVTMLLFARIGYKLDKWKGYVLMLLYFLYFGLTLFFFYIPEGQAVFSNIIF